MVQGNTDIILQVTNTTTQTQNISFFDSTENVNNPILPQIQYTFDLTSILADTVQILIVVTSLNNSSFSTIYATSNTNITTAQQAIDLLNTLNIGIFSIVSGNVITYFSGNTIVSSISGAYNTAPTQHQNLVFSNTNGSLLYNLGYSINGVGTFTLLPINTFWKNITPSYTQGRMNNLCILGQLQAPDRSALYYLPITNTSTNIYIGFSFSFVTTGTLPSVNIFANDTLVLSTNDAAMQTNINTILGGSYVQVQKTFWHIYPINLPIGNNILLVNVTDGSGTLTQVGIEVYQNTASEITSATSTSTLNILGNSLQIPNYFIQI